MKKPNPAKEILRRIDARIGELEREAELRGEKFNSSDRAISLAATGKPETLRGIRRNVAAGTQVGVNIKTLRALARTLKVKETWLIDPLSSPFDNSGHIDSEQIASDLEVLNPLPLTVPLVGYVGAADGHPEEAHFYAMSQGNYDQVTAPPNATTATKAVEIRGTSLGKMLDRWIAFYDDVPAPMTDNLIGQICIVGLSDDRVLIKKVVRGSEPDRFNLLSEEPPIEGVRIEWAAKIHHLSPR